MRPKSGWLGGLRQLGGGAWSRWPLVLALLGLALLFLSGMGKLVLVIWGAYNSQLLLRGLWRGLRGLRRLWETRGVIARWAFWPALGATLLVRSRIEPVIAEFTGQWLPSGVFYATSILLVLPVLFLVGVLWGLIAAAVGMLVERAPEVGSGMLRFAVRVWWLLSIGAGLLLVATTAGWLPGGLASVVLFGLPGLTRWLQRLALRHGGAQLADRFELWLSERFVWSRRSGRTLDLRGEILAAVGFLLVWLCVSLRLLLPLQASALLSGIQFFNAVGLGRLEVVAGGQPPPGLSTNGPLLPPNFFVHLDPPKPIREVALLEWDAASLRRATTTHSEASLQAELIRALKPLGVRRIVLPTPLVEPPPFGGPSDPNQAPALQPSDYARARHDLPLLLQAMREASNVVLISPSRAVRTFDLEVTNNLPTQSPTAYPLLSQGARELASARLAPVQIAALPAIPFQWSPSDPAPVPLVLFNALRGSNETVVPIASHGSEALFQGKRFPLLGENPSRLLLDFVSATPGHDFTRVSFGSVFSLESQFDPHAGSDGAWVPADRFFRGRVVFIPPLKSETQASPLGALETTQLMAYGLRTLLGNAFLQPMAAWMEALIALGCAWLIGRMVVRRNPLKASWRLALLVMAVLGVSGMCLSRGLWLDPVFPITAASAAFLLVTQFTFSLERTAKERSRFLLDRFVAPEVAAELLDSPATRLGLGGQRERVAVLFADVRGFTQFAEGHSPEEVMKVVNAYLHVMTEALHAHGGILDKYTGDGLMALFRMDRGITVARAVEGALAMRDAVLALSADRKAGGDPSLRVGISLHVGDAVVGLVGNLQRQVNFTALGHTVVVAARLQTLASGGEVVVSQEVQEAVGDQFTLTAQPTVFVKGVTHPVVPFVVERSAKSKKP